MLKINCYVLGMMSTNCYILYEDTQEPNAEGYRSAVIIDAAAQPDKIISICENELKVKPEAILLTHGHFDHIMAVDAVRKHYGIDAYCLDAELEVMENPDYNLSGRFETAFTLSGVKPLKDGEVISLIGHDFKVIATPGHTKGGCSYYVEDSACLFSGDTLFYESYGKYSFATGNFKDIVLSIVEKLLKLPPETRVFPGHERATTVEHERKFNICNVIYQKNKEAGRL
ncbi:MAG: MBL fold metallo-hydrolase [Eubacteriales bacterium]|nr:MBL fold metallo-hydrolase [Eubacteriales bacterium]